MKLRDELLQELQSKLGQTQFLVAVSDGPRTLKCQVEQCDPLGAAVTQLSLETAELASVDIAKLEAASQSLCQRVNYLLEPISPIETDADGCVVQMRSSPPQKNDTGRYYYELLLRRGGAVTLSRYEKQAGSARIQVPATLTHEVLGRLAEDFHTAIDEALTS